MTNKKNYINDDGQNVTQKQAYEQLFIDTCDNSELKFSICNGKQGKKSVIYIHYNVVDSKTLKMYLREKYYNNIQLNKNIEDFIIFWLNK